MGLTVDSYLLPIQSHATQKLGQKLKIRPDKLQVLCPNLRIRGHLPAHAINGGGDSLWKWPNFRLSRTRDLDLVSGHIAYRYHSSTSTYIPNIIDIKDIFLWTDGRKNVWTDIWDPLH